MKLEYWRLSHDIVPFDVASSRRDKLRGAAEKGLQFCSGRGATRPKSTPLFHSSATIALFTMSCVPFRQLKAWNKLLRYEWHFGCQLLISRWWSRPVTQKFMNQQGLAWRRQAESTWHIAIHIASSSIVRRTKLLSYRWIFAMITYVCYPPSPGAHKKPWSVSLFFIIVSYFTICQRALQAMMWLSLTWILKTRA